MPCLYFTNQFSIHFDYLLDQSDNNLNQIIRLLQHWNFTISIEEKKTERGINSHWIGAKIMLLHYNEITHLCLKFVDIRWSRQFCLVSGFSSSLSRCSLSDSLSYFGRARVGIRLMYQLILGFKCHLIWQSKTKKPSTFCIPFERIESERKKEWKKRKRKSAIIAKYSNVFSSFFAIHPYKTIQ